jgi:hypothetical protein
MPLTSIVVVVLRLFALDWLVQGFTGIVWTGHGQSSWYAPPSYAVYLPSLVMVAGALLLFMWSKTIARAVTPKPDPQVQLAGITVFDLYCFAFTFLGLYFVIPSISGVMTWLHYLFIRTRGAMEGSNPAQDFYGLADNVVRLLAGGACLLFAARFARKLAAVQGKEKALIAAAAEPSAKP